MKNTCIICKIIFILSLLPGMHQTLSAQVTEQDSLALVALYNSTDGPNWTHNDNWLSGPVATWYGVTVTGDRVTGLDLTDNNLSGTIPPEIGDLTRLGFLILYVNHLTGSIPPEIGNLTDLKALYLGDNQLSGAIPAEIGNLTRIHRMGLTSNQLTGEIPPEIGNLTNLTTFNLSHNQLTGSIPAEIGNLTRLQYLYLADNQFAGPIPPEIFALTNLSYLELNSNRLSGTMPPGFKNLTNLAKLNLSYNELSDTIKVNLAKLKSLQWLYLANNNFSGPVPACIDSLPNLKILYLYDNRFVDLPDLSPDTSLTKVSISNNRFTFKDIEPNVWVETFYYSPQDSVGEAQDTTIDVGTSLDLSVSVGGSANQYQWTKDGVDIPGATSSSYQISSAEWADIGVYICKITNTIATKLTLYSRVIAVDVAGAVSPLGQDSLALVALYNSTDGPNWTHNDNWLSGPVSTWYGVTVSGDRVTGLDLTDNNLSGTIPPEISALTRLDFLILYENHLTGSIPPEIGDLTHLETLGLSDNQLTGSIPPEIGDLTHLETLGLSENQFDGSIPAEIGNLTNLAALYLHQNQLSGTLPVEIGNLTRLGRLSLAANQLTGEIPPEIGNLTNLQVLYLSHNQLSGRIPTEMGQLTKLKTLRLFNNALSDTVKVNFANMKKLKELYLNGNEFVGSLPAGLDSLPALQNLWLSNNHFTDLQNLSPDTSLIKLSISNNRFTFKDIEPNVWVETFYYSPQDSVGEERDTTIAVGEPLELAVLVGGTANQYQWMKDGDDIPGANGSTYTIASAGENDIGDYVCKITNTLATQLTLYSRPIHVTVSGATGVSGRNTATPKEFALHQNYPNPFNPTTSIAFSVAKATHVELTVFDRLGREVATLVNRKYRPGQYNIKFDAGQLASGLYFYRMRMGDFLRTRKMLLVR